MKITPNTTTFSSDSNQRSEANRRAYCARPTKSLDGSVRELLTDTRTDQKTVPR